MAGLRELYGDMYHWLMGAMAHPLRGMITEPIEGQAETDWQKGIRKVTISVTPSGASYPRTYVGVPYSVMGESTDFKTPPNAGDYVDVVFKGGSSEFPTVVGRHGGTETSKAAAAASASRSVPPTSAASLGILSSNFPSLFPGLPGLSPVFNPIPTDPFSLAPLPGLPAFFAPADPLNLSAIGITGINGSIGGMP